VETQKVSLVITTNESLPELEKALKAFFASRAHDVSLVNNPCTSFSLNSCSVLPGDNHKPPKNEGGAKVELKTKTQGGGLKTCQNDADISNNIM
jgi:hypothetical protein